MKALVTGATGFIGSHLVEALLREGIEVRCLVRNPSKLNYLDGLNVKVIEGDCTDGASLSGSVKDVDYIFHLAGLTKAKSEDDYFAVNRGGTENIVKAVLKGNPDIKRFFYLSSLAAAGPSSQGKPLTEECECRPVSVYGKTKFEGESIVYSQRGNMPVTVVRPPAVYGPRDRDLLIFFRMVKSGLVPYWGKCYYSFIYVDDLVTSIMLSALSDAGKGEIFFVSDEAVYSTDDVLDAIAEAVERRPVKMRVPRFAMSFAGFISERAKGPAIVSKDKIREMKHAYWTCDTKKAASLLHFVPKVKIKEGARWTADWYRIHQWL